MEPLPKERSGRLSALVGFVLLVAVEVGFVAGMVWAGSVERWRVDWPNVWQWMDVTPTEDVIVGLLRWVGLVLAVWLLASSVLYALARLTRIPGLIRSTEWLTIPVVRGVVDRAVVVTMATSVLIGSRTGPALADGATPRAPVAAAIATAQGGQSAEPRVYATPTTAGHWEVQPNENLYDVAAAQVAHATGRSAAELRSAEVSPYWRAVIRANQDTLQSGDPRVIFTGERIVLPPLAIAARTVTAEGAHVVQPGDTLWDISAEKTGDPYRWPEIFERNHGVTQPDGSRLENPDLILPEWVLEVPDADVAADSGGAQSRPGSSTSPTPPTAPTSPSGLTPSGTGAPATSVAPPTSAAPTSAPATSVAPSTSAAPTSVAPPTTAPSTSVAPPTSAAPPTSTPATSAPSTTAAAPVMGLPVPDAPMVRPGSAPSSTSTPPTTSPTAVASPDGPPLPSPPSSLRLRPPPTRQGVDVVALPEAAPVGERAESPAAATQSASQRQDGSPLRWVGGLLAASLVTLIVRRRLRQDQARRPGRRVPMPEPELVDLETLLRARADLDDAEALDRALRAMAAGLRSEEAEVPEVLGVQLGPKEVEILLAEPTSPAPPGFRLRDGGRSWVCARRDLQEDEDRADDEVAPLPGLVTLGVSERGPLLVNLEAGGVIAIAGDPQCARRILLAIALELEGARWADYVSVELVGFNLSAHPGAFERMRQVESIETLDLDRAAQEVDAIRAEEGYDSTLAGRAAGLRAAGDWMNVTVALCATPPPPAATPVVEALVEGRGRCAQVLVAAGELKMAHWRFEVSADGVLSIPPLDMQVGAQMVSAGEAEELAELLAGPEEDTTEEPFVPEIEELAAAAVSSAPSADVDVDEEDLDEEDELGPYEEPERPERELRILGPVEVLGADGEKIRFERAKDRELVALLGLAGERGIDADRAAGQLWPEKDALGPPRAPGAGAGPPKRYPSAHTLQNTVTRARRALGRASDGTDFLPKVGGGIRNYALYQKGFSCDYWRFQALVRHARRQRQPEAVMATLWRALDEVRGQPYEESSGFHWAQGGVRRSIAGEITDVAEWLAELCRANGDAEGARRAAQRGQLATPYAGNERLGRCEMRAAELAGDRAEVRAIYRRLGADEEELHPETVALYERLTS
ncbi:MAG: BTAD domain-containing putative transcriptional regulator [Acidimicrobiales bacterium]